MGHGSSIRKKHWCLMHVRGVGKAVARGACTPAAAAAGCRSPKGQIHLLHPLRSVARHRAHNKQQLVQSIPEKTSSLYTSAKQTDAPILPQRPPITGAGSRHRARSCSCCCVWLYVSYPLFLEGSRLRHGSEGRGTADMTMQPASHTHQGRCVDTHTTAQMALGRLYDS